jgi:hypothetical protein
MYIQTISKGEHHMAWRTITAQTYMNGTDPEGYDEVFITDPATGFKREVWDCGIEKDDAGKIAIYTSDAEPIYVEPSYRLHVR